MPFELVDNTFSFCFAKLSSPSFWYILLYGHPPSHIGKQKQFSQLSSDRGSFFNRYFNNSS